MPAGFKIADGYVEVHSKLDRAGVRRDAKAAADAFDEEGKKREGSFLKWLFKTNPSLMRMLEAPIGSMFGSPIVFAAAATFATTVAGFLSAAIVTGILGGLGAGLIAAGAFALKNNKKLTDNWDKLQSRIKKTAEKAAMPLLNPLIKGMDLVGDRFEQMGPALNRLFKGVSPMIEPLVNAVMGFVQNMLPGIEKALPGMQAVIDAIAVHMPGLGTAIGDFFATLAENKDLLIRMVGLTFTWLDIFFKVLGPLLMIAIQGFVNTADAWNAMTDGILKGSAWIVETWKKIPGWWDSTWGAVKGFFVGIGKAIGDFFTSSGDNISGFFSGLGDKIAGWWDAAVNFVKAGGQKIVDAVTALGNGVWSTITHIPQALQTFLMQLFDGILYLIGYGIGSAVRTILGFPQLISLGFQTGLDMIKGLFTAAFNFVKGIVTGFFDWIKNDSVSTGASLVETFTGFLGKIRDGADAAFNWLIQRVLSFLIGWKNYIFSIPGMLKDAFTSAWKFAVDAGTAGVEKLLAIARALPGRIKKDLGNLGDLLKEAGKDLIRGLVSGLESMLGWAIDAAKHAAGKIMDGIKGAMGINSPSTVARDEVGAQIPPGIGIGIKDNAWRAYDAMDEIARNMMAHGSVATPSHAEATAANAFGPVTMYINIDSIQELEDIQAFLDNRLVGSSKASTWAGNLYEQQGKYVRDYS